MSPPRPTSARAGLAGRAVASGRLGRGMTVLELMIVLAIIGAASMLARSGFRLLTRADLVENSTELAAVLKRASALAMEQGELHRVVFDLDRQVYAVEQCQGAAAIQRGEQVVPDAKATQEALARGKDRMANLPADAFAAGDPDEATRRATALAGHHVADRTCAPVKDAVSGDATGKPLTRALRAGKGIKFKQLWVQHRDDGVTSGQVALYFFPSGASEKAVVELTDGSDVFSVYVWGLTGRVELKDGEPRDVESHMLRNVMGDRDAKREDQR